MVMAGKSVTNGGHHPTSHSARYPHSTLESKMHRTFYPKYSNYFGDGSGRDTYVVLNNGGLANSDKRAMMWRPSKVPKVMDAKIHKKVASLAYRSDGTGRDSYVVNNNGGLVADFNCSKPDVIFKSTLRHSMKNPIRTKQERIKGGPDQTDFINWMEPRHQQVFKRTAVMQKILDERLSPPKEYHHQQNFTIQQGLTPSGF